MHLRGLFLSTMVKGLTIKRENRIFYLNKVIYPYLSCLYERNNEKEKKM